VTRSFRVLVLLAPLTLSAASKSIVLEVDGGAYDRANTPVVFRLPESLANEQHFVLAELDTNRAVDVQADRGRIVWIMREKAPARRTAPPESERRCGSRAANAPAGQSRDRAAEGAGIARRAGCTAESYGWGSPKWGSPGNRAFPSVPLPNATCKSHIGRSMRHEGCHRRAKTWRLRPLAVIVNAMLFLAF